MQIFKMVNHFFNHEREVKDVWPNPYLLIDLIRCLPFPACFLLLILFNYYRMEVSYLNILDCCIGLSTFK
jgi:hypothetical protein